MAGKDGKAEKLAHTDRVNKFRDLTRRIYRLAPDSSEGPMEYNDSLLPSLNFNLPAKTVEEERVARGIHDAWQDPTRDRRGPPVEVAQLAAIARLVFPPDLAPTLTVFDPGHGRTPLHLLLWCGTASVKHRKLLTRQWIYSHSADKYSTQIPSYATEDMVDRLAQLVAQAELILREERVDIPALVQRAAELRTIVDTAGEITSPKLSLVEDSLRQRTEAVAQARGALTTAIAALMDVAVKAKGVADQYIAMASLARLEASAVNPGPAFDISGMEDSAALDGLWAQSLDESGRTLSALIDTARPVSISPRPSGTTRRNQLPPSH